LDDQAETVLDHLLRGCGLAGLAGMVAETDIILHEASINYVSPVGAFEQQEKLTLPKAVPASSAGPLKGKRQTKILRPLLRFSKAQLEDYARRRDLRWREDSSNLELKFRRNRIRYELLPLLKSRFNPQITNALERLASIAASADYYLHAEAEARLAEIVKEKQPDKIILDIEQFWKYFPIIRFYVVRSVLRTLLGKEVEPTFLEISRMLALMRPSGHEKPAGGMKPRRPVTGKRYVWRQQVEVSIDHDGAVFQRLELEGEERGAVSEERKLASRFTLCASRLMLPVTIGHPCLIPNSGMALLAERKALSPDWRRQVSDHSQFVDAEKVQGSLRVRFPQPGDRFSPLRGGDDPAGSKKLSDFFTDLKVPFHRRHLTPVLECDSGIVWVCGYRIGNRFKITPATQTVLHLQLLQTNNLKIRRIS
jgi:tRNA(Ile)-lysidine synthase